MASTKYSIRKKPSINEFSELDSYVKWYNKYYVHNKELKSNSKIPKKCPIIENNIRDVSIRLKKSILNYVKSSNMSANKKRDEIEELNNEIVKMQINKAFYAENDHSISVNESQSSNSSNSTLESSHSKKIEKSFIRKIKKICSSKKLSEYQVKNALSNIKNISSDIFSIIVHAPYQCRADILSLIIMHRDHQFIIDKNELLCLACARNKMFTTVKYLINQKSDVNYCERKNDSPLDCACRSGNIKISSYLINSGADIKKIKKSAYANLGYKSLQFIKFMITKGLDITAYNNQLLLSACQDGDLFKIKSLIKIGANLKEIVQESLNSTISRGCMFYEELKQVKLIKFFLENGADLNKTDVSVIKNRLSDNPWLCSLIVNYPIEIKELIRDILYNACKYDQINTLKIIYQKGFDIHAIDEEKICLLDFPFAWALAFNKFRIAKYLISKAPFIYRGGNIITMVAADINDIEFCVLHRTSMENNYCPIIIKIKKEYLLYRPHKIEQTLLSQKDSAIIKLLPFDRKVNYLLIKKSDRCLTRPVIKSVQKLDEWDNSILNNSLRYLCSHINFSYVSRKNRFKAVKFLLDHYIYNKKTINYAFQETCKSGYLAIVKLLIKMGACYRIKDIPTHSYAQSALAHTCMGIKFSTKVAEYLLKIGVDINEGDGHALHVACDYKMLDAVKFLINHGADITVRNNLILKNAYEKNNQKLINVLKGASPDKSGNLG